jgi:hypothetical protein
MDAVHELVLDDAEEKVVSVRLHADDLFAYAKQLGLKVTTAREAPSTVQA